MIPSEQNTQVFIIRIWREPWEIEEAEPEWRGVIEHVPSGERRYMQNLNEISDFIRPYLEKIGVKFSIHWRVRRRLKRWKAFLKMQN
jgi:hypothetical protein